MSKSEKFLREYARGKMIELFIRDGGGELGNNTRHIAEVMEAYKDHCSKEYPLEEVRMLLQKQKEQTIFSLGLSSAVYVYPTDYEKMKEWMMACPLVL